MRRLRAIILVFLLSMMTTISHEYNFYFRPLRLIICEGEACWHEAGHAYDHHVGWISRSPAFRREADRAVQAVFEKALEDGVESLSQMEIEMALFPGFLENEPREHEGIIGGMVDWDPYQEFYAEMARWSKGDPHLIPEDLRPFFDLDWITEKAISHMEESR